MEKESIQWTAPEYIHVEKTTDWYWIVGIVTVSIAILAVILNNIIFAVLILISSFTLTLFASRRPNAVTITVDGLGVTAGTTHYPYVNLESFWVETRDIHPRVLLKSQKIFMPYIVLLMDDVAPESVREILKHHLKEEEHWEPLLEKIFIYFGF